MIDFGFDKLALIGAVALVVIGPEKLPRVARTVGLMVGKAQRYLSDVKSEVSRSMELEELKKVKEDIEEAARDMGESVSESMKEAGDALSGRDQTTAAASTTMSPFMVPPRQCARTGASNAEPCRFGTNNSTVSVVMFSPARRVWPAFVPQWPPSHANTDTP